MKTASTILSTIALVTGFVVVFAELFGDRFTDKELPMSLVVFLGPISLLSFVVFLVVSAIGRLWSNETLVVIALWILMVAVFFYVETKPNHGIPAASEFISPK
jgi:hypothetical protein